MSGTDRFRLAARAYFAYGVVYWVGGVYLLAHGVGVAGGAAAGQRASLGLWAVMGLVLVFLVPFLLRHPRAWFERWIVSRRDFARILALFMAFRAFKVGEVALRSGGGSVAAPWGVVTFQAGAVVFFFVTVVALVCVALAAWGDE
ncbi:MAG: hypothetical protein AUH29_12595 [Candidatus Rokubacteria bacterium 13_1_40CM_69_27]|nr:MAG: hypothetical protein AUH29_12595 [Candidatus Rokubacteria bacterium 13_1_40CM_69_27]OLC33769.1 MAG: hypothetical protein AUH81_13350 [Candidatus Rokubacteria bacterium 13_1_40CM_4_69_5]OLE39345.1 MAG: hypothetical protein AUG00_02475 [Candidatus Rokubacteria bacterium 13_1_20CM_2_70_7]